MLMAAKNQLKVSLLSIKYAIMREMINKFTFISNIVFMMLNNASMLIQWVILFSIKDNVGDYTFKQVILLWAFAAGTYGIAHFFFKNAFSLSSIINTGKLDTVLVQPKNVLLSIITTDVTPSALGDLIYGYILLFIYGATPINVLLFTLFIITGGFIITAIVIIFGSLSFWFGKSDVLVDTSNTIIVTVSTYPDGIFKGLVKVLLYTIVPVGLISYVPIQIMIEFDPLLLLLVVLFTIVVIMIAFLLFYAGLKNYTSTNLMNRRT